jgi:fatty acid desaturase
VRNNAEIHFRRGDDPAEALARAEAIAFRKSVALGGYETRMLDLQRPRPTSAMYQMVHSWSIIAASTYAALRWGWTIPFAVIAIASRQRALGNVLHDASHGNLWRRPGRFARIFIAAPLFEDFEGYRRRHLRHHAYLGDKERDPDYYDLPREPTAWRVYRHLFLSWSFWLSSAFGEMKNLRRAPWASVLAYWGGLVAVLGVAIGPRRAVLSLGLWFLARGTAYHAIRAFTELADHVGLARGTILSFTRSSPGNMLSLIFHPHNDSYHLAHHLYPRVPLASLGEAHQLLLGVPDYAAGHICDGYFFGRYSVARSLVAAGEFKREANRSMPLAVPLLLASNESGIAEVHGERRG